MLCEKYKDALPQESIAHAKEVCRNVGANVSVKVTKRLDGVYSAVLSEDDCGWVTCGKGTNEAYCEASAFGEAIEHMSHYFAYNMNDLSETAVESCGFQRYPDEQILPIDEIPVLAPEVLKDMHNAYSLAAGRIASDEEICAFLKRVFDSETTVFVPYYSVRRKCSVMLPELLISNLCGTNGCGAGNTPEEAVGHGLDELAERFVKYRIYNEGITPPEIPREYIEKECRDIAKTIRKIENSGKFRILVKDCSLGVSFPVVAVLLVDYENQKYMANLGSHPRFEIAIERCITEMFQFYESGSGYLRRKKMSRWNEVPAKVLNSTKNWVSLLKDDVGFLSDSFFAGEPAWEFSPWVRVDGYSNRKGVNDQIKIFSDFAEDIFIRDNSYLGFPAYRVYIPGISTTHLPFDESQFECAELCGWLMDKKRKNETFSKEELKILRDKIFSLQLFASSIFFNNMSESISYALYAALEYELGNIEETAILLKLQDDPRCDAAAKVIELHDAGVPASQIRKLIELFFDKDAAEFGLCWCGEDIFAKLFDMCSGNTMPLIPGERHKSSETVTDRLHVRIKEEMATHVVDQEKTGLFIDEIDKWA